MMRYPPSNYGILVSSLETSSSSCAFLNVCHGAIYQVIDGVLCKFIFTNLLSSGCRTERQNTLLIELKDLKWSQFQLQFTIKEKTDKIITGTQKCCIKVSTKPKNTSPSSWV